MPDLTKAINDLLQIHEGLLATIKRLVASVDEIVPLAAKPLLTDDEIKLIHENISNFGVAFFYMREGEKTHEHMDYETLKYLINDKEQEGINEAHGRIGKLEEQMQHELHYSDKWNQEQIKEHLVNLKKHIHDFQDLVIIHAMKENELLKRGLK